MNTLMIVPSLVVNGLLRLDSVVDPALDGARTFSSFGRGWPPVKHLHVLEGAPWKWHLAVTGMNLQ
jgi:hypothetical protein